MKNFVITVARGFGSGGRAIAAKLADELNIHSYDNRILTLASQYSGYPEHYFKEADETLNGSLITKQLQALPKRHSPTGEFRDLLQMTGSSSTRRSSSRSLPLRSPA